MAKLKKKLKKVFKKKELQDETPKTIGEVMGEMTDDRYERNNIEYDSRDLSKHVWALLKDEKYEVVKKVLATVETLNYSLRPKDKKKQYGLRPDQYYNGKSETHYYGY